MWLFSETGFVSAVAHRDDPGLLMVRARDRASLRPLVELAGVRVKTLADADYPHRVVVSREVFRDWAASLVEGLDYPNYKSRVAETRGRAFAAPLHDVWSVMHEVEEGRPGAARLRSSLHRVVREVEDRGILPRLEPPAGSDWDEDDEDGDRFPDYEPAGHLDDLPPEDWEDHGLPYGRLGRF